MEFYVIDLNRTSARKDIIEAVNNEKFKELAHFSYSTTSLLRLLNTKGFDNTKYIIREF